MRQRPFHGRQRGKQLVAAQPRELHAGWAGPIRERLGVPFAVAPHGRRFGDVAVGEGHAGVVGEPGRPNCRVERGGCADVVDDALGPHIVEVVLRA